MSLKRGPDAGWLEQKGSMGLAIFYETLLVILISALTAAVCLSSYLVTKRKTVMLFACIAFVFSLLRRGLHPAGRLCGSAAGLGADPGVLFHPLALMVGPAFLGAFWFMVCESTSVSAVAASASTPIVVYAILSLILLAISGESKGAEVLLLRLPRRLFMFWILAYGCDSTTCVRKTRSSGNDLGATRIIASLSPCSEWSWWPRMRCSSSCFPPTRSQ